MFAHLPFSSPAQAKGSREEAEALVGLEVFKALGFALKIAV